MHRLLLALALSLPGSALAVSMATQAKAIDAPRIGRPVAIDGPITAGRAQFTVERARSLWCGEQPCGLLLDGLDGYYRVEDPLSQPLARRNLRRATRLGSEEKDGVLEIRLRCAQAVLWSDRFATEASAEDTVETPKWVERVLDQPFFRSPSAHLIAGRGLGDGSEYLLLKDPKSSGSDAFVLLIDPLEEGLERLLEIEEINDVMNDDDGRHVAWTLATQPIDGTWTDPPPPPFTVIDTKISVDATNEKVVEVVTSSTLRANRDDLRIWRAGLISRRLKPDGRVDEEDIFLIEVSSVLVDGHSADWLHEANELFIRLPEGVAAGTEQVIEVRHSGRLAIRPHNNAYWVLGTWPWYPQPTLASERSRIELELTVGAPFSPFASGRELEREDDGERRRVRTVISGPSQRPMLIAGRYKPLAFNHDDRHVVIATYVFAKPEDAETLANKYFAALKWYENLFDQRHPFPITTIVEAKTIGIGQAPAGMILVALDALSPLANRYSPKGVNQRIFHEIAHAWWGHLLQIERPEEQWLTEGLAEYSAAWCLEALLGGPQSERARREFESVLGAWRANSKRARGGACLYLANHFAFFDQEDSAARANLLYNRGPLVLHAIRLGFAERFSSAAAGDEQFTLLLRRFLAQSIGGGASTEGLRSLVEEISGEDWEPFFRRYVYGTETPPIH